MSINAVLDVFDTTAQHGGYTITRTANGGYDPATGDATDGAITTFALTRAVVQDWSATNGTGAAIKGLLEGRHMEDVILIMTDVQLYETTPQFQADRVTYLGELYEVIAVEGPLSFLGETHYEVYAARMVTP